MVPRIAFLTLPLALLIGCAPAKRLDGPVDWPEQWAGRTLWTTPHAYIYAARDASAGELDRLAQRVAREYVAEVEGRTPPPLILVRDAGEPLPGEDFDGLVRSALRLTVRRDFDSPPDREQVDAKMDGAHLALQMSAVATGTEFDVVLKMMPLTCDALCLRDICGAPEALAANVDEVLILPTRACLREGVRRVMKDALKQYGIGPVAQLFFAPILVLVETQTVDKVARLRDAALFNHWLFQHDDLAWAEKRKIASAYLERWGHAVEADAAVVAAAARDAAAATTQGKSAQQAPPDKD
ncbi:MAG: hypothetical protein ACE5GE_15600 [Phycisphaerae bacterium]